MEQTIIEEKQAGSGGFDIKRYFSKLINNYYWFILTLAISGTSAYMYLRYTQPLYEVSTFILVKSPNDAVNTTLGGSAFTGGGTQSPAGPMVYPDPSNEIFKLQSEFLLGEVVDSLNLDLSAVKFGRVRSKAEDLEALPFTVTVIKSTPQSYLPLHKLFLTETSYSLQSEKKNIKGYYGQPLVIGDDTLIITLKSYAPQDFSTIYGLSYIKKSSAISQLTSRISVQPAAKAGPGMLQILVRDEMPRRAKKIIDVLIDKYDHSNLAFKNKSLRSEIDFLNERVGSVYSELLQQENTVRDFKVSNKVNDVASSATQLLSNLTTLDVKKNDNESKRQMAELVESNIRNFTGQEQVISNATSLGDPVLASLVSKYNEKVFEKNRIQDRGTSFDPRLAGISKDLQDLRINILNSLDNLKREIRSNNEFLASQERSTTSRFQTMPEKEKDLSQVNRLLTLKQTQYIHLLQTREDKNIRLVSSQIGESRIIDSRTNNDILYPKRWLVYAVALGFAFLLPALIILIRMILNKRIETRKDIENATFLPIAGEIELEPRTAKEIIVSAGYQTDIAEQFRSLRTNLIYLKQETAGKVLMVTSAMPGEGKSFVSINLANTLASTGKKVILVELDLRKPQLAKTLGLNPRPGLTDYLITTDMLPHDIIQKNREYENLSFVTCGPIPPNPGELILTKRLQNFFEYLRNNYDIIVVDTPPVGIVSDAIIIGNMADLTLFILRHRYSFRSSIQLLNELSEHAKLPHLSIVINSIKRNKGFSKEIQGSYNGYLNDDKNQKGKNGVHRSKKESTSV
ncbi:MAG: polysaccharide biosynthesis tyrosine autokinase [Chitinophagaceae bacterium]|nr:polysaccharide biosynthesis tyrosine autokinase [Chitinophagaceae bacterium]